MDVFENELYVTMYRTNDIHRMSKFKMPDGKAPEDTILVRAQTSIRDILVIHMFKHEDFTDSKFSCKFTVQIDF